MHTPYTLICGTEGTLCKINKNIGKLRCLLNITKKQFNKRTFLKSSLLATGGILLVQNFISCSNEDDLVDELEIPDDLNEVNFDFGVANFDPTQSQVIIWTRYTSNLPSVNLIWQLARDANFEDVVRSGEIVTEASRDYTVAVEVQNLEDNQKLYYRFGNIQDTSVSVTGESITLPRGTVNEVKLGVASCTNFAVGLFNVYNAMANSNIDLVVHLGDYIYEYGKMNMERTYLQNHLEEHTFQHKKQFPWAIIENDTSNIEVMRI